MQTENKVVFEKAVNWWCEKLRGNAPHSNGDSSLPSIMACIMADRGTKPVTDEQIAVFKEELMKELEQSQDSFGISLECDYGPCRMLDAAAQKAGINVLNFPFKTGMEIRDGKVRVSDGYAQPYVEI